jgi:predicted RNA-binding protein with RPS1 domain
MLSDYVAYAAFVFHTLRESKRIHISSIDKRYVRL